MDPSTDHDPVLVELLAARPDVDPAHTDADSPTAVALRTGIAQHTQDKQHSRRQILRIRWVAAAAAAAIVAAVAVTASIDGPEPAAASIEDIAAATDDATRGSGQATMTYEETWPGHGHVSTSGDIAFSDDDVDIVLRDGDTLDGVPYESRDRVVDGERYSSSVRLGDAPDWRPGVSDQKLFDVDPRLLLQVLEADAGFTVVGPEELDGRPVTHLRASTPEAVSLPSLVQGPTGDTYSLDALNVWVDGDDVVYRLDIALTRNAAAREIILVDEGEACPEGSSRTPDLGGCEVPVEPYWVDGRTRSGSTTWAPR